MSTTIPSLVASSLLASFLSASPAAAQEAASPGSDSAAADNALVFYWAGLEELLSDPRDAGLLRALQALDDRLLELPEEVGADELPPGFAELVLDLLSLPMDVRGDVLGMDEDSGAPIVEAQLTLATGSVENAAGLANRVDEFLRNVLGVAFETDATRPSFRSMGMPQGTAFFGAGTMTDGSGAFQIAWGEPSKEALDLATFGLPSGVRPAMAASMDLGPLQGVIDSLIEMSGPDGAELRRMLGIYGLSGEAPISMSVAVGHAEDRAHYAFRHENWASQARLMGAFVDAPLTADEIRLVPADATTAAVTKIEPHMLIAVVEMMSEGGVDIEEMFRSMLGFDLRTELLDHLGTTSGFYMSDSTGGGGFMSSVVFLSLVDSAGLAETIRGLAQKGNDLGLQAANGYVRFDPWGVGEALCWTLTFPGLPVPLELSIGLTSESLFAAITPQALMMALDHAASGRPGLADQERFRSMTSGSLENLHAFSFSDVPRRIRDGYGVASLIYSSLANAVRSPVDAARDPGLVMPSYPALVATSKPRVLLSRLVGEDIVTAGQGDRSITANLCSEALLPISIGLGASIASVALLPVVTNRLNELEAQSSGPSEESEWIRTDLVTLQTALDMYAIDHAGVYPATLEELLGADEGSHAYLSDDGSLYDPWGFPYGYVPPTTEDPSPRVFTLGADAEVGGEGSAQDVDSQMVRSGAY